MKFYLYLALVLFTACRSPRTSDSVTPQARAYIRACADSINRLTGRPEQRIPAFLGKPCLDYNRAYWRHLHAPVPMRRLIVARVKNEAAIRFLITRYRDQLAVKCPYKQVADPKGLSYYKMPDEGVSFLEMFEQRLQELQQRQNL